MNGPMRAWAEKLVRKAWLDGRLAVFKESDLSSTAYAVTAVHDAASDMPNETATITIEQMAAALRDFPDADFSRHMVRAEEVLAFVGARDTSLAHRLASLVGQHPGNPSVKP